MDVQTERLRIRDVVTDDLEAMVELWGDPDVERWMTGFGPRTRAQVVAWLPETIAFNNAVPRESHNCAITVLASGEIVGWIGFGPASNEPGAVNFGYALIDRYRGLGYGGEALRAAIDFCFTALGVGTFTGETAVGNDASAKAMERAGMRRTGITNGQIQFRIDA